MKRPSFAAACLFALALAPFSNAQQAMKPDIFSAHVHIPLAAIPTSTAVALAPVIVAGITMTSLYLVNTNSSTVVTVTITCTTGGVVLVQAAIPGVTAGGNNIPVQFPADGIFCLGGVSWVASAAGVNGTIAARY